MSATRKAKPYSEGEHIADFYPTPEWAVDVVAREMLQSRPKGMHMVYEPGVGEGRILQSLHLQGARQSDLRGCELREDAAQACRVLGYDVSTSDFLSPDFTLDSSMVGLWPMNPPYGGRLNLAQKFIEKALDLANDGAAVWVLLRMNWLLDGEVKFHRQTWLREGPGTPNVYGLNRRPSFTGDGHADATTYCWAMWVKGRPHELPAFKILNCQDR